MPGLCVCRRTRPLGSGQQPIVAVRDQPTNRRAMVRVRADYAADSCRTGEAASLAAERRRRPLVGPVGRCLGSGDGVLTLAPRIAQAAHRTGVPAASRVWWRWPDDDRRRYDGTVAFRCRSLAVMGATAAGMPRSSAPRVSPITRRDQSSHAIGRLCEKVRTTLPHRDHRPYSAQASCPKMIR